VAGLVQFTGIEDCKGAGGSLSICNVGDYPTWRLSARVRGKSPNSGWAAESFYLALADVDAVV